MAAWLFASRKTAEDPFCNLNVGRLRVSQPVAISLLSAGSSFPILLAEEASPCKQRTENQL